MLPCGVIWQVVHASHWDLSLTDVPPHGAAATEVGVTPTVIVGRCPT